MLLDVSAKRVVGVSQGLTEEVYLSVLRPEAAAFHLTVRCLARTVKGEGTFRPSIKAEQGWGSTPGCPEG